jgi:LPXTG-motif cell wall-anchored protein
MSKLWEVSLNEGNGTSGANGGSWIPVIIAVPCVVLAGGVGGYFYFKKKKAGKPATKETSAE